MEDSILGSFPTQSFNMEHLRPSFFFDFDVIKHVGKRTEEETRGHSIMLASDVDSNLCIAALLDGSSIDFLFGVRRADNRSAASRANDVKKFMRNLDEDGQQAIAKFYFIVYKSVLRYQKRLRHPCSCLWVHSLVVDLHGDIDEAYVCLRGIISAKNIIDDDDQ